MSTTWGGSLDPQPTVERVTVPTEPGADFKPERTHNVSIAAHSMSRWEQEQDDQRRVADSRRAAIARKTAENERIGRAIGDGMGWLAILIFTLAMVIVTEPAWFTNLLRRF